MKQKGEEKMKQKGEEKMSVWSRVEAQRAKERIIIGILILTVYVIWVLEAGEIIAKN